MSHCSIQDIVVYWQVGRAGVDPMDQCRSEVTQCFLYKGPSAITSNQHFARERIFFERKMFVSTTYQYLDALRHNKTGWTTVSAQALSLQGLLTEKWSSDRTEGIPWLYSRVKIGARVARSKNLRVSWSGPVPIAWCALISIGSSNNKPRGFYT